MREGGKRGRGGDSCATLIDPSTTIVNPCCLFRHTCTRMRTEKGNQRVRTVRYTHKKRKRIILRKHRYKEREREGTHRYRNTQAQT